METKQLESASPSEDNGLSLNIFNACVEGQQVQEKLQCIRLQLIPEKDELKVDG